MHALAHKAYGQTKTRTIDDKQLELAVFKQITEALEAASSLPVSEASVRAEALNKNTQLWTILTTDLLHPENAYDANLKRDLLILARFIEKKTPNSLTDNDALNELIEINQTVIAGLVAKPL